MNQQNEQLDIIEELLQRLLQKTSGIEETITKSAAPKQPDTVNESDKINDGLTTLRHSVTALGGEITRQLNVLDSKISLPPALAAVQNHHHFDVR